ncbi:hypothetical protein LUW77_00670 [Streptomyces radiopugnans]|nr:hypothetical protein LUW77_00670 [Streptomyces radiopugnans]
MMAWKNRTALSEGGAAYQERGGGVVLGEVGQHGGAGGGEGAEQQDEGAAQTQQGLSPAGGRGLWGMRADRGVLVGHGLRGVAGGDARGGGGAAGGLAAGVAVVLLREGMRGHGVLR